MFEGSPPRPYGQAGLTVLGFINLGVGLYLLGEISSVANLKTAQANSVSIAEAAYMGALWTKIGVAAGLLLAFDLFCVGVAISLRITQLHRAVVWAAEQKR